MKKFIAAVAIFAGFTAQAHAWGDREQGILAGVVGTLILQHVTGSRDTQSQPVPNYPPVSVGGYPQQPPVVQHYPQQPQIVFPPVVQHYPRPVQRVCDSFPMYDPHGRYHGHRQVCRTIY